MSDTAAPRPTAAPNIIGALLSNPAIVDALIKGLVGALSALALKLFSGAAKPPAVAVTTPKPAPKQDEPAFPDDIIPATGRPAKVASVRLKLARAQYSRERFPEMYTDDNPFGLYSGDELHAIQEGRAALNYGSKFWLDLTPFGEDGRPLTRPEFLAAGLAYRTEHHVGDAFIVGAGALPNGEPADYRVEDSDAIGNGITAWKSSLGCLHQMKANGEGKFPVSGSVDGVGGESFVLAVS